MRAEKLAYLVPRCAAACIWASLQGVRAWYDIGRAELSAAPAALVVFPLTAIESEGHATQISGTGDFFLRFITALTPTPMHLPLTQADSPDP